MAPTRAFSWWKALSHILRHYAKQALNFDADTIIIIIRVPAYLAVTTPVHYSVLNVKVLVGAFNQEKAQAFSVIVQFRQLIVCSSSRNIETCRVPQPGPNLN